MSTSQPEKADADGSGGRFHADEETVFSELLRFKQRLAASRWLLFELMRFKRALVEKLGVEQGFRAYLRALGGSCVADIPGARLIDCDAIELRRIQSTREIALAHGDTFVELAPAGATFAVPPPALIGEGNSRTLHGVTRSTFLTCLSNVRVRSRSAFVCIDDMALLEYQGTELTRVDDDLDFDPWVFHAANETAWMMMPEGGRCSISLESGFWLIGPHSHDFGHWLWEYLPKYIAAKLSGRLPPVPILIDAAMPATHRQALECMVPEGVEIIALPAYTTAEVSRLWCASGQMYMPVHAVQDGRDTWEHLCTSPARFSTIIHEMARCSVAEVGNTSGPQRLFLARKPHRHCKLINHAAVEAIAMSREFTIVYPEDFDFRQQALMLSQARFVLAPYGSAILLEFFAKPKSKLCMLSHPYTFEAQIWAGILSGIGIDVTLFSGPFAQRHDDYPEMSDYWIDERRFSEFLDSWLSSPILA